MNKLVRAYRVSERYDPEYAMLVFAETGIQAKKMAVEAHPAIDTPNIRTLSAKRIPDWDMLANEVGQTVILCNDELPNGYKFFEEDL